MLNAVYAPTMEILSLTFVSCLHCPPLRGIIFETFHLKIADNADFQQLNHHNFNSFPSPASHPPPTKQPWSCQSRNTNISLALKFLAQSLGWVGTRHPPSSPTQTCQIELDWSPSRMFTRNRSRTSPNMVPVIQAHNTPYIRIP